MIYNFVLLLSWFNYFVFNFNSVFTVTRSFWFFDALKFSFQENNISHVYEDNGNWNGYLKWIRICSDVHFVCGWNNATSMVRTPS